MKILSIAYAIGAVLHLMDVLSLRLDFAEMSTFWKVWIIYLLIADTFAAVGLWKQKLWGISLFLVIAISQLIAYIAFKSTFGDQMPLIIFHFVTISIFVMLKFLPPQPR